MKRKVVITAGVAMLGTFLWLGTGVTVQAQNGGPQGGGASVGGTRIALVNMYVIMKGYKKNDIYTEEMKALVKPYQDQAKKLKENYDGWVAVTKNPQKSTKEKDDAAKYALEYEHQMKVLNAEWQKKIMNRDEQQLIQLYHEIEDSIQRYAKSNGIQMVFQYFEPADQAYTAKNIARKLNVSSVGGIGPIYFSEGLDISQPVLQVLNSQYPATAASTTSGQ